MFKKILPARGLSLIELMVVIAVGGILATLAYPSYVKHLARGHRAEASVALQAARIFMERAYATQGAYAIDGMAPVLPAHLQAVPSAAAPRYRLSVTLDEDASGYTLAATPAQPLPGDVCGTLTLTGTGERGVLDETLVSGSAQTVADCWR